MVKSSRQTRHCRQLAREHHGRALHQICSHLEGSEDMWNKSDESSSSEEEDDEVYQPQDAGEAAGSAQAKKKTGRKATSPSQYHEAKPKTKQRILFRITEQAGKHNLFHDFCLLRLPSARLPMSHHILFPLLALLFFSICLRQAARKTLLTSSTWPMHCSKPEKLHPM